MTEKPNVLYPGLPNYQGRTEGYFTCLWHNRLVAHINDVRDRIAVIRHTKPVSERPIRLRHIVHVPLSLVPRYLSSAYAKRDAAYAKWDAARAKLDAACAKFNAAYAKLDAARAKRDAACANVDAALERCKKNRRLLAYLTRHVPDCCWDGNELVFS